MAKRKTIAETIKAEQRQFAEHYFVGSLLEWPSPPRILLGGNVVESGQPDEGPARGKVAFKLGPHAFVRFAIGDGWGEPVAIDLLQPCKWISYANSL